VTRILSRALFCVLVAASFAAFFVAQRVKRAQPVVEKVRFTRYLSPNGDGIRERARLSFRLKKTDRVDVAIVNRGGDLVRGLVTNGAFCGPCTHRFRWNGRDDAGKRVPDGGYLLRVTLREQARTITSPRKVHVDTTPPSPVVTSVAPTAFSPDGDGFRDVARVRFEGPAGEAPGARPPRFIVYRTGGRAAQRVAGFSGRRGSLVGRWDGRTASGKGATAGNYLVAVQVRDAAGNLGSGPRRLPPRRGETKGRPGVRVRYIAAATPQAPLRAGARASLRVFTDRRVYRWGLARAGNDLTARRRVGRGRLLRLRAPRRSGAYVLTLAAGSNRFRMTVAVRPAGRPRVLVVLPTIAWVAANPFDANQDGWGDTLTAAGSVGIGRPLVGHLLPPSYSTEVEPLLRMLDREGLRYDLTTDLALSRDSGPSLAGHSGVLFAGPEPYVTDDLAVRLLQYVRGGGRAALLATDSFHRSVRLDRGRLTRVGARRSTDLFGEATRMRTVPLGSLAVLSDRIGFFAGTGGRIGQFTRVETSEELPEPARLLAGAGLETERPALVVYRLGRGVVARMGADGLALQAAAGVRSVAPLTLRLWKLLAR
jgi:hypothetical protein